MPSTSIKTLENYNSTGYGSSIRQERIQLEIDNRNLFLEPIDNDVGYELYRDACLKNGNSTPLISREQFDLDYHYYFLDCTKNPNIVDNSKAVSVYYSSQLMTAGAGETKLSKPKDTDPSVVVPVDITFILEYQATVRISLGNGSVQSSNQ